MARTDDLENFLTDVASAIKTKKGTTDKIAAENFDSEIESIETGIALPDGVFIQDDVPTKTTEQAIWLKTQAADEIVFLDSLPDSILNAGASNWSIKEWIDKLSEAQKAIINSFKYHVFFCVTGYDTSSYLICANSYTTIKARDYNSLIWTDDATYFKFVSGKVYQYDNSAGSCYQYSCWIYTDFNIILNGSDSEVKIKKNIDLVTKPETGVNIIVNGIKTIFYQDNGGGVFNKIIDTSDGTATAENILKDKIAYVKNEKVTGTMANNEELTYTPTMEEQEIPKGYTSGGSVSSIEKSVSYQNWLQTITTTLPTSSVTVIDGYKVLYYGANLLDKSSNNKNGTLSESGWEVTDDGIKFTGGYGVTGDISSNIGTFEIYCSVDKDFSPNKLTAWYQCSCIMGCELSAEQKDFGIVINSNGRVSIGYAFNSVAASDINIIDGKLHHIVLTYDGTTYLLYVDGVLVKSVAYSTTRYNTY